MRIVFMGTPEFAVPALAALIENGYNVVGVFTQPDKPKGRGNKMVMSPVKELALANGIPVYQPVKIRKDGLDDLIALAPDVCVTAAFGQILSQKTLDVPRLGTVNVHASLLPRHRGSAPINYAVWQGDKVAGVTTMLTDKGIDTGDMLLKAETPIGENETAGELTMRLSHLGAELLIKTLKEMEAGKLARIPQNPEEATYDPMLTKEMGLIDWQSSAEEICLQIRGLSPWPGTYCPVNGGVLKIWQAEQADGSGVPGTILEASPKHGLLIACGTGAVRVTSLQAPNGKRMDAKAYLPGHPMEAGKTLSEVTL